MKKILTIASILFLSVQTYAQNDAKKILDEVSAKVKSYKNFELNFTYTINDKSHQGKMSVENNKYVVNLMGVTQIYDGVKTYMVNPNDEEVSISSKASKDGLTLTNVLSFYTKGYNYSMDTRKKESGKTIQYVKLKPTSSNSDVKEILLGIDINTKMIYKKVDVYKNGSKSTLVINSFKTNQAFSKNHFTFTKSKYPNYYINNLD